METIYRLKDGIAVHARLLSHLVLVHKSALSQKCTNEEMIIGSLWLSGNRNAIILCKMNSNVYHAYLLKSLLLMCSLQISVCKVLILEVLYRSAKAEKPAALTVLTAIV